MSLFGGGVSGSVGYTYVMLGRLELGLLLLCEQLFE